MSISVSIPYTIIIEELGPGKEYFVLSPDSDKLEEHPFNWCGKFNLNGKIIDVIIPQRNPRIDPKEEDFELPLGLPFTKLEIIKRIIVVQILKNNLLEFDNLKLVSELKIENPEIKTVNTVTILFQIVLKLRKFLSNNQYKNAKLINKVKPSDTFWVSFSECKTTEIIKNITIK